MRVSLGARGSAVAAALIVASGLGAVVSAVFPPAPPTVGLHFLLGFLLVFASAIATAFFVGFRLRRTPGWERLSRYSIWTGIGAVLLVAFSCVALNSASPLEEAGIGGLIERLLVLEVFAWDVVFGLRLMREASDR